MATQSASAQFVANDLYMGFQNSSATSDYIIDLGSASSIVGAINTVSFSVNASFLSAVSGSGLNAGVVGGKQSSTGTADLYLTTLRTGSDMNPQVPGSSIGNTMNRSGINGAASTIAALTGVGGLDSTKSWQNNIAPTDTGSTFFGNTGLNPDSSLTTSSVLYEDLWTVSSPNNGTYNPYTYLGYFTIDDTGSSPNVFFSPEAVPEPSTVALAGMGGLLALAISRRFVAKKA